MSTGNEIMIKNKGNEYYLKAGIIINIGKDGELKAVGCEATDSDSNYEYVDNIKPVRLYADESVYTNDSIYSIEHSTNEDKFFKYTFSDNKLLLNKEDLGVSNGAFENEYYLKCLTDLKTDGEYIYFLIKPTKDYFNASPKDIFFKMGKVSLDGKNLELFNDTAISSYTINDGWIYYFDNGYSASSDGYSFDCTKSGLYKMKTDGSERVRILDNFEQESDNYKLLYCYGLEDIKVCGDYIYFVNYDKDDDFNGQGNVCRIKKDGSDYKEISKNKAYCITFNDEGNKLFYANNEDGLESRKIYEVSLDSLGERKIFENSIGTPDIEYYNNYLYLSTDLFSFGENGSKGLLGKRYDIANKKLEDIYGYYNRNEIQDGIFQSVKMEGPYLEWKSE